MAADRPTTTQHARTTNAPQPPSPAGRGGAAVRRPARPAAGPRPAPVLPAPRPLPAGLPREWYVRHNRQIKAMRLAIALLNTGVHTPEQARNARIRRTAERIGVHPPSAATCRLVRRLLPDSHVLTA